MKRILMTCVLVAAGCGGGSSPREQCEDLLGTACDRVTSCFPQTTSKDTCIAGLKKGLPCDTVKSIGSGYDDCVHQVESASCSALLREDRSANTITVLFPAVCTDAVVTGDGAPAPTSLSAPSDPAP